MLEYENELYKKGITLICGIDEVGRGPLFGPVVASAVILPVNYFNPDIKDSKKLTAKKREKLYDIITKDAISVGIGIIDEKTIDKVNIYEATKLAMYEAINSLKIKPEHLLIDAMKLETEIPSTSIIKGDALSESIAAASIIAKVTRDRMIDELAKTYDKYDLENNKGYGTKKHIEALHIYGATPHHRKSFSPVSEVIKEKVKQI